MALMDYKVDQGWCNRCSNCKFIPKNEKNIAYKAALAFFKATGLAGGAKILIHKNNPQIPEFQI